MINQLSSRRCKHDNHPADCPLCKIDREDAIRLEPDKGPEEAVHYSVLRRLGDNWLRVEERLVGTPIKAQGYFLSVERYEGKMRLCYQGKPVADCTVADRITAAGYLKEFIALAKNQRDAMTDAALAANRILEDFLNEPRDGQ